jgi:hypothetical protein
VYVREALTTFFDSFSQASSNVYQYIAETRLCLASPRPGAINLVSGLPTSSLCLSRSATARNQAYTNR